MNSSDNNLGKHVQSYHDLRNFEVQNKYKADDPMTWKWKYYYYFEKSPAYWCYEHVAFLFNKIMVPMGTKFFVLMRDPIKRTFSYWSHQTQIRHLNGPWNKYIENGLNDENIKNMVKLMKNESAPILDIKDELVSEWRKYAYSKNYGYIGARVAKKPRPNKHRHRNRNPVKFRKLLNEEDVEKIMRERIMNQWRLKHFQEYDMFDHNENMTRRRLWTAKDPGYVKADTNPNLGVGASCYVIPLLMWLEYIPIEQMAVMQSELMYGSNHNNFIMDVRCWFALGYEYETMQQCRDDRKKKVDIQEEHQTVSARKKVEDKDARRLYNGLYKWCNKRLLELLKIEKYRGMLLHEMKWEGGILDL